jgi:hypothetical protein
MTAVELIKRLAELRTNAEVYIWIDGERYPIVELDLWDSEHLDITCSPENQ